MRRYQKQRVSLWQRTRKLATACALSVMVGLSLSPSPAFASEGKRQFTAEIGLVVDDAIQLAEKDDFSAALSVLDPLVSGARLSAYERGVVLQLIGQYRYELDELDVSQAAVEAALLSGGLTPQDAHHLELVIAQVMIGAGQHVEGAERLEAWIKTPSFARNRGVQGNEIITF
jgi:hypothetical protein